MRFSICKELTFTNLVLKNTPTNNVLLITIIATNIITATGRWRAGINIS